MTDHLFIVALSVLLAVLRAEPLSEKRKAVFERSSYRGHSGVFGANEVPVSVKEGEFVNLPIKPDETYAAYMLLWLFNDETTFIARIDRNPHNVSIPGNNDERFRNRLKMDGQTASLTISDVRNTDTGLYKLKIISGSGISYKTFNVTVTEPSQTSHWMITGPVLAVVLLLVLLGVSVIIYKRSRKSKSHI
ncbi:putative SLAM family member 6, partial [Triplophysa rosa]